MSTLILNCSPMTAVVLENVSMYEVIWLEKLTHGCQNGFLKIALPSPGGLVQTSAAAHGWGLLEDSFPSLKRPGLDCKEENACKCFKENQEVRIFWFDIKGTRLFYVGFKKCASARRGAVQLQRQVQEKREVEEDGQQAADVQCSHP